MPRSLHFAFRALRYPFRQLDDAAAAEDRLGDEGGEIARALPVDEIEGVVELRLPGHAWEARTIPVRRGDREGTGRGGAIASTAGLVGGRRGASGHAVPGLREADHLPTAGHQFGNLDRCLISFPARGQKHDARQRRHATRQGLGEVDDRRAEHAGEQMIQPAAAAARGATSSPGEKPRRSPFLSEEKRGTPRPSAPVDERAQPARDQPEENAAKAPP